MISNKTQSTPKFQQNLFKNTLISSLFRKFHDTKNDGNFKVPEEPEGGSLMKIS